MSEALAIAIADGVVKAMLLGIEADKVREAARMNPPDQIPAVLARMCDEARARAHKTHHEMPDDPA